MRSFQIIKHNKKRAVISLTVAFVLALFVFVNWSYVLSDTVFCHLTTVSKWNSWNQWITIMTFLTTVFIGWRGFRKNWEEKLPNKLTVHFVYDGKYVMSCYHVYLAEESDTRAWGQQVGRQMNDGNHLKFGLVIKQKPMEITDNCFKHYELTIELSEEPEIFKKPEYIGKYITWAFTDERITKKIHDRLNRPLSKAEAQNAGEPFEKKQ